MKISIAYDSVYGNTELVAKAIAEQAQSEGHAVELISLQTERTLPSAGDVLFVGGPTHMKKLTRPVARFLKRLDRNYWSQRPVVAFDTYGPIATTEAERQKQESWINPGAAGHIQELARSLGLSVFPTSLRCAVTGLKGPLAPDALDSAKRFVHEMLGPNVPSPSREHVLAATVLKGIGDRSPTGFEPAAEAVTNP